VQLSFASSEKGSPDPTPPPIRGRHREAERPEHRWSDYKLVGDARVPGHEGRQHPARRPNDYRVEFRIDQIADESG